jgi:hypothetical protein
LDQDGTMSAAMTSANTLPRGLGWLPHATALVMTTFYVASIVIQYDGGGGNDSVSVILAAAAVFLPLLRVVQRWVDRRFNRAAYNAQKVVDSFGERLRNGADPHTAGDDLVGAVAQTLEPATIGVWARGVAL